MPALLQTALAWKARSGFLGLVTDTASMGAQTYRQSLPSLISTVRWPYFDPAALQRFLPGFRTASLSTLRQSIRVQTYFWLSACRFIGKTEPVPCLIDHLRAPADTTKQ